MHLQIERERKKRRKGRGSGRGREVEIFRGWTQELDSVVRVLSAGNVKCPVDHSPKLPCSVALLGHTGRTIHCLGPHIKFTDNNEN